MNIDEMLEVLQAAKRGEEIEVRYHCEIPESWRDVGTIDVWNFSSCDYRIAPKKEMTLVEELRHKACYVGNPSEVLCRAADRITELEAALAVADEGRDYANALLSQLDASRKQYHLEAINEQAKLRNQIKALGKRITELEKSEPIIAFTTDELLAELKRRVSC